MGKKIQKAMEEVALRNMVSILEQIREERGLDSKDVIQLLRERGTLHLLNSTELLFTSVSDTDDETLKILLGEDV